MITKEIIYKRYYFLSNIFVICITLSFIVGEERAHGLL